MKAIDFSLSNTKYAENQDEYLTLPAHKSKDGIVTSCWKATLIERFKFLFTGKIWLSVMTFNKPLQPLKMDIDCHIIQDMIMEVYK